MGERIVDINDATPRPWKRSCFLIQGPQGDHVTHTGMGNLPPSRSHESEANAELIVTAVNAYDANQAEIAKLRKALDEILTEAEFVADAKAPFSTWVAEKVRAALKGKK